MPCQAPDGMGWDVDGTVRYGAGQASWDSSLEVASVRAQSKAYGLDGSHCPSVCLGHWPCLARIVGCSFSPPFLSSSATLAAAAGSKVRCPYAALGAICSSHCCLSACWLWKIVRCFPHSFLLDSPAASPSSSSSSFYLYVFHHCITADASGLLWSSG